MQNVNTKLQKDLEMYSQHVNPVSTNFTTAMKFECVAITKKEETKEVTLASTMKKDDLLKENERLKNEIATTEAMREQLYFVEKKIKTARNSVHPCFSF